MGTMLPATTSDPGAVAAAASTMRGPRKAAILLMTLGEVHAKPLLRDLRPADGVVSRVWSVRAIRCSAGHVLPGYDEIWRLAAMIPESRDR